MPKVFLTSTGKYEIKYEHTLKLLDIPLEKRKEFYAIAREISLKAWERMTNEEK